MCVCVFHTSSIHLSQHLGCFPILAIVNNSTVKTQIQISLGDNDLISFGYMPKCGIPGWCDGFTINFLRNFYNVFHSGSTNLQSHQSMRGFPILCMLINIYLLRFGNSHSNRCEVIYLTGFDLHIPDNSGVAYLFIYFWSFICLLWRNTY